MYFKQLVELPFHDLRLWFFTFNNKHQVGVYLSICRFKEVIFDSVQIWRFQVSIFAERKSGKQPVL